MKNLTISTEISLIIFLFSFFNTYTQEALIENGDAWYYYDKGYLNDDWINITDFSSWESGKSPLGYGDKKNLTNLYYGENKEKKHITKYFKKKIFIRNNHLAYEFKIQRDDGAVVYINGKELFRDNMQNSTIKNTTLAISTVKGDAEHRFYQHFFDNSIFKEGENIISVSIHQAYERSSDCIFSLELIAHDDSEVLSFVLENKTNIELENKIKELNAKFEYEKIVLQKESLESDNYNLGILVLLISILLIVALLGYYFIIGNSKRRNKEIDIKLTSLKNKNLEKDKEMIALTTNLLHNKQYFKEIKADLKGLKTEDKAIIKSITNQIDYVLERDEDWNVLKEHFNAVHNQFYDKIIEKHPTISETELRHCMFIKLHMQTKEIARILLIDPRSVQTARYRIKKKMDLSEDKDLRDYLLSIH